MGVRGKTKNFRSLKSKSTYVPAFILLELFIFSMLPCVLQKLLQCDHVVLVLVNLTKHMFSHSVHLLKTFHGIIFFRGVSCIIHFIQLKRLKKWFGQVEEGTHSIHSVILDYGEYSNAQLPSEKHIFSISFSTVKQVVDEL